MCPEGSSITYFHKAMKNPAQTKIGQIIVGLLQLIDCRRDRWPMTSQVAPNASAPGPADLEGWNVEMCRPWVVTCLGRAIQLAKTPGSLVPDIRCGTTHKLHPPEELLMMSTRL